jgi:NAD(P)-dependent dehydrogenase (short-subunit alcohol dehydrogenase family)
VQASLPALKLAEAASVVFFSSVAVRQGFASHASVAMAKGAVEGLTLSLAAELAPRVRVNAIAPSLTVTPLTAGLTANEKMAEGLAQSHPLQRLGRADDPAALAAFLLGDEASWMTGQIIGVDGGRGTLRTKG